MLCCKCFMEARLDPCLFRQSKKCERENCFRQTYYRWWNELGASLTEREPKSECYLQLVINFDIKIGQPGTTTISSVCNFYIGYKITLAKIHFPPRFQGVCSMWAWKWKVIACCFSINSSFWISTISSWTLTCFLSSCKIFGKRNGSTRTKRNWKHKIHNKISLHSSRQYVMCFKDLRSQHRPHLHRGVEQGSKSQAEC